MCSALGDPLIKGLTEVANKRPEDPIAFLATYLYNFANSSRNSPKSAVEVCTCTRSCHAFKSNFAF